MREKLTAKFESQSLQELQAVLLEQLDCIASIIGAASDCATDEQTDWQLQVTSKGGLVATAAGETPEQYRAAVAALVRITAEQVPSVAHTSYVH